MRRLLVAIDGSPSAERVVDHIVKMDKDFGPFEVHVIHVAPEPAILGEAEVYVSPVEARAMQEAAFDRALKPAVARLQEAGVPCQVHRASSDAAAEAIAAKADELGADLIVMGTHGRSTLVNFFMGSVATGVVHRSARPVLLVK